jgi:glycosyltransferase involved in cell wall biosynthesis
MLTVIFATRNGSRTLSAVLDGYLRIQEPEGGWKLVVVNNASTDESVDIIDSYQGRLPLTILSEPRVGKNAAINTALKHIQGDLVVLTDDDAVPAPDWLVAMRYAADTHLAYTVFGGVVKPRWEVPPSRWILESVPLGPVFTLTSKTLTDGPIDPALVYGPNMAVRAEIFGRGFQFDTTIGPQGPSYAMGSETEFVRRLANQGCLAWHVTTAQVEHMIREFQMQRSWVLRRAVRFGRGVYRMTRGEVRVAPPTWLGVPRYLLKEMFYQGAMVLKGVLMFRDDAVLRARWELNVLRGQVMEAFADRSSSRPVPSLRTRAVG